MTLDADVGCLNIGKPRRVYDVRSRRGADVLASRAMTSFASHVPFRDGLGLNVVVHRMAPVTQRSGRTAGVRLRIETGPPVRADRSVVRTPDLMAHVPLRPQRKV